MAPPTNTLTIGVRILTYKLVGEGEWDTNIQTVVNRVKFHAPIGVCMDRNVHSKNDTFFLPVHSNRFFFLFLLYFFITICLLHTTITTVVRVHESFFLFARSLQPQSPPQSSQPALCLCLSLFQYILVYLF